MKKQKEQKNLLPDTYAVLSSERKCIQKADLSWFMKPVMNILAILVFAALDFSTLFSQFDNNMTAEAWSIAMVSGGICLAENFVPNVSSRFLHNMLLVPHRRKANLALLALSLVVVVLLLSVLGYMRWETRNTEISNELETVVIDEEPDAAQQEKAEASSGKDSLALVLLMVPWVTSGLSFFLGYLTDDPMRNHYCTVKMSELNTQAHLAELEATLVESRELDPAKLEELVHQEYTAARETAHHLVQEWLAQWELMLIAHLGSAESAEILTQLYEQIELESKASAPVQLYKTAKQNDGTESAA